jgi:hypothetical protein
MIRIKSNLINGMTLTCTALARAYFRNNEKCIDNDCTALINTVKHDEVDPGGLVRQVRQPNG